MDSRSSSGSATDLDHLEDAVGYLSKKWSASVVRVLLDEGAMGFSALQDRLDGVSGKVLSDCLDSLQECGVVDRHVLQEVPLRVEYRLTDRGSDLESVVAAIEEWSADHLIADTATVLLADDDRRLVEMHERWLAECYEVRTATDGETAKDRLDETVDVLVVGRRMSGHSGSKLAQYAQLSDLDCAVVFLSSVAVDESLLEVRFDDYVRKPTTPEDLRTVVERWLSVAGSSDTRREYESLQSRLALFESALGEDRLRGEAAYQQLHDRAGELEARFVESPQVEPTTEGTNERPV
jgi:DNA-binding HxlR family transcriptional regulator